MSHLTIPAEYTATDAAGRILIGALAQHVTRDVTIVGWLHNRHDLKDVTFLNVRDRTGTAQVVVSDATLREQVAGIQAESVVSISGTVMSDARARGGVEIHALHCEIMTAVRESLPFEVNKPSLKAGLDIALDHAAIALRHQHKQAALRVSARLVSAYRRALNRRGFTEIFTPKIVASATEGGSNVFPVEYFGRQAYLAQSPQLYKQVMVGVLERVYEVGPVFRAEPHATSRHLNEYVSLDLELGFIRSHRDIMGLIEELLHEILDSVRASCSAEVTLYNANIPSVGSIPIVDFRDAQEIILHEYGEDCRHEPDLAPQHERWLGEWAHREFGSEFLFVEGYPTSKRPFYTMPGTGNPEQSRSFDLLFRGLELITGGQREHRYERLTAIMAERGIDPAPFAEYLEAFRFGIPPEGGCAIGLERFVAQLLGVSNVRSVTAFPRDINRLTP